MEAVTSSPLFGIVLSILAYAVGVWLNRKAKTPLVNPLLVAIILVALVLLAFHIPLEHYQAGGGFHRPVPGSRYRLSGLVRLPAAGNPEKEFVSGAPGLRRRLTYFYAQRVWVMPGL